MLFQEKIGFVLLKGREICIQTGWGKSVAVEAIILSFTPGGKKNCKGKCKRMINSNLFIGIIYDPIEGKNTSATDKEDKKVSCEAQG